MRATVKGEFFEVEVEGTTEQELWERMAFWHGLPTICPMDNMPVRFGYSKNDDGNEFHYLESTGPIPWQFQYGTRKEDKKLYPGKKDNPTDQKAKAVQSWAYWDRENNRKVVGWKDGKFVGDQPEQAQQSVGRYPTQPEREEGVSNGASPIAADSDAALRQEMERLGAAYFGTGWPAKKEDTVNKATGQTDSSKLTTEQVKRIIAGIKLLQAERQKEKAA
jgi:hypothetical protein